MPEQEPAVNPPAQADENQPQGNSNLRFTIAGLMMVMLIFSVIAAAASFLWQAKDRGASAMMIFFPFVLISPMGLMILVCYARDLLLWINRR